MGAPLIYVIQIVVYPKAQSSDPFFFLYILTFLTIFNHLFLSLLTIQLRIFHPSSKSLAPSLVRRSLNFGKAV